MARQFLEVTSVKLLTEFEVAISQAAGGGSFAGLASASGRVSSDPSFELHVSALEQPPVTVLGQHRTDQPSDAGPGRCGKAACPICRRQAEWTSYSIANFLDEEWGPDHYLAAVDPEVVFGGIPCMVVKLGQELPLDAALANASTNRKSCNWPNRTGDDRLRPYYDPVLTPRFTFAPQSKIFMIGSCFARHIEGHLGRLGFEVPMLALRVPPEEYKPSPSIVDKFTPLNALQEVERTLKILVNPQRFDRIVDDVLYPTADGKVIDLELRDFVPVTRDRALERRRQIFDIFTHIFDADCIVISLGLVECWLDRRTGLAIQETPHAIDLH